MEESLTDCLVKVGEDLTNLNRVRDFLEKNGGREKECSITWRTIEAFNSILTTFSSQDTPQTNTLDTLLDSFYFLARKNTEPRVWHDFGFEIGIISGKILSAIDRSDIFDILFWKLLAIINIITEHDATVWKSSARQILNIFINKKFSLSYFETVLKLYISILRNVENFSLTHFSAQNLHLLKTFSNLVQRIGDFEIQSDIIELVFLHLSEKTESMLDFFTAGEKKLFESLSFRDFEKDTRTYLNAINKPRKGLERKIFSIGCEMLYFGGCFVEPPIGANFLWVDANKDTERLSIRCADVNSNSNRVIYIKFSDVTKINLSNDRTDVNCLTIQTKSLWGLQFDVKNNEICLMTKNSENLTEFVTFLNGEIKKRQKNDRKISKTRNSLFIDRTKIKELQDSAITSSENQKTDKILSDITNLFEKTDSVEQQMKAQSSKSFKVEIKSPGRSQDRTTVAELSPNSFVESLNRHIGRESSEFSQNFEDSVETIEFLQKNNSHRLFRTPEKLFDGTNSEKHKNKIDTHNFSFIFDEGKENRPIVETFRQKLKTYERKRETGKSPKPFENFPAGKVLKNRKILEMHSQEYFKQNILTINKPSLPKFKRKLKTKSDEGKKQEKHETSVQKVTQSDENKGKEWKKQEKHKTSVEKIKQSDKNKEKEVKNFTKPKENQAANQKHQKESKSEEKKTQQTKPSLLDPNSYTFKRWCEPTTSERSNFWLKKLQNDTKKSKTENHTTFDFSEDSDSISTKTKRKKRKVIHSKRKPKTKGTRQASLKEVKEILKKKSPPGIKPRDTFHAEESLGFSPRKEPEIASRRSSTPESIQKNGNDEKNEAESVTREEENVRENGGNKTKEPRTNEQVRKKEGNVRKEEAKVRKDKGKFRKAEEKWRKGKEKVTEKDENISEEDVTEEEENVSREHEKMRKEEENVREEKEETEVRQNKEKLRQNKEVLRKHKENVRKEEENVREEKEETEEVRQNKEKLIKYKENVRKEEENKKTKKKMKSYLRSGETMTSLQNRLLEKEKQNKQETDEILQTVRKSVNYLFNHIQRREGKNVLSYLATAEGTAAFVESSAADLKVRAKRIERAMLYFRGGCSVSEMFHSLEGQLSEVRNSLNKMTEGEDNLKTINRVNERLLSLIKSGVEKAIDKELATKREKLLKCASIFMGECGNFP